MIEFFSSIPIENTLLNGDGVIANDVISLPWKVNIKWRAWKVRENSIQWNDGGGDDIRYRDLHDIAAILLRYSS